MSLSPGRRLKVLAPPSVAVDAGGRRPRAGAPRHSSPVRAASCVLTVALSACSLASWAEPPVTPDGLTGSGLSRDEVEQARRGGVVARILPQREDNAVVVLGLIFVDAPPAAL
jgi:hypothetical protein